MENKIIYPTARGSSGFATTIIVTNNGESNVQLQPQEEQATEEVFSSGAGDG